MFEHNNDLQNDDDNV